MKTGKQRAAEDAAKLEIKQRDTILLSETRESGLPSPNASKLGLKLRVAERVVRKNRKALRMFARGGSG